MEKKRESEVFKSDLLAETERVRDAKFHFELDTERFLEFKKEQDSMRTQVTQDLKLAKQEREALDQEINRLTNDIKAAKDQAIALEKTKSPTPSNSSMKENPPASFNNNKNQMIHS